MENKEVREVLTELMLAGSKINAHAIFADQYEGKNDKAVADSAFTTFLGVMEHILRATNILKEDLNTVEDAQFMLNLVETLEKEEEGDSDQTFH
jgi:hypothetical protein